MARVKTVFEVGQKYNRLEIVEKLGYDKHKNRLYKCKCDCGNEIIVRGNALTSGNTQSCGCLSLETKKSKRLPNNRGVINQVILQYKRHAKDRNLAWDLSFEEVEMLIQQPCFYCGAIGSNFKITKICKEGFHHNGIDRVDSSKGYFSSNVVPCCKICNKAKSDMNQKDFIFWAKRVSEHTESMAEQWVAYLEGI